MKINNLRICAYVYCVRRGFRVLQTSQSGEKIYSKRTKAIWKLLHSLHNIPKALGVWFIKFLSIKIVFGHIIHCAIQFSTARWIGCINALIINKTLDIAPYTLHIIQKQNIYLCIFCCYIKKNIWNTWLAIVRSAQIQIVKRI